jgi:hypothetical protein
MLITANYLGVYTNELNQPLFALISNTANVPHGFAGYTGSRATFAKPLPKLLRFGPN